MCVCVCANAPVMAEILMKLPLGTTKSWLEAIVEEFIAFCECLFKYGVQSLYKGNYY